MCRGLSRGIRFIVGFLFSFFLCPVTDLVGKGHCDVVHAVEAQHRGLGDSSVLYIPAVPLTVHK